MDLASSNCDCLKDIERFLIEVCHQTLLHVCVIMARTLHFRKVKFESIIKYHFDRNCPKVDITDITRKNEESGNCFNLLMNRIGCRTLILLLQLILPSRHVHGLCCTGAKCSCEHEFARSDSGKGHQEQRQVRGSDVASDLPLDQGKPLSVWWN